MVAKLDVDSISIYLDTCTSFCGNLFVRKINAIACRIGHIRDFIRQLLNIDSIRRCSTRFYIRDGRAIFASQSNFCIINYIIHGVILDRTTDLFVQVCQVLCRSIRGFDIGTI